MMCNCLYGLYPQVPQGCVILPLLFIIYTHDDLCTESTNNIILKYAEDTLFVGLITDCDELLYRQEIDKVKTWCENNKLLLYVSKTRHLIFDFRLRSTCD